MTCDVGVDPEEQCLSQCYDLAAIVAPGAAVTCDISLSNYCEGACTEPVGSTTGPLVSGTSWKIDPARSSMTVESGLRSTTASLEGHFFTGQACDGCPIEIQTLSSTAAPFTIRDYHFTNARIWLNHPVAAQRTDGGYVIPPRAARVDVSWTVNGHLGGVTETISREVAISIGADGSMSFGTSIDLGDRTSISFSVVATMEVNLPPVLSVLAPGTAECASPAGTLVHLDGSGSYDPEGEPLELYWVENFRDGDADTQAIVHAQGPMADVVLSLGHHALALYAFDASGAEAIARTSIDIVDTTPPEFGSVSVTPDCLWAPNHKYVVLELGSEIVGTASDVCAGELPIRLDSVEVLEDGGPVSDGSDDDVVLGESGVCLLTERTGLTEAGRTYRLWLSSDDGLANSTSMSADVVVPHSGGCTGARGPVEMVDECPLPARGDATEKLAAKDAASPPNPQGCTTTGGAANALFWAMLPILLSAIFRRRNAFGHLATKDVP